ETVRQLVATHEERAAAATLLTTDLLDPGAYGRIVRDENDNVARIVETKYPDQVDPAELAIREINLGAYAFDADALYEALARVGDDVAIGPFAYIRPGTRIANGAKIGSFVEVKNSNVGEGTKIPHLSYIGDADIGSNANIAAGNITANYHAGKRTKSRTTIGDG